MSELPGYLSIFLNLKKKNSVQNYPKAMDVGHLSVWEMMSLHPERPHAFGNKKLSAGTFRSVCGTKAPTCLSRSLSLAYFCLVNKSS